MTFTPAHPRNAGSVDRELWGMYLLWNGRPSGRLHTPHPDTSLFTLCDHAFEDPYLPINQQRWYLLNPVEALTSGLHACTSCGRRLPLTRAAVAA